MAGNRFCRGVKVSIFSPVQGRGVGSQGGLHGWKLKNLYNSGKLLGLNLFTTRTELLGWVGKVREKTWAGVHRRESIIGQRLLIISSALIKGRCHSRLPLTNAKVIPLTVLFDGGRRGEGYSLRIPSLKHTTFISYINFSLYRLMPVFHSTIITNLLLSCIFTSFVN